MSCGQDEVFAQLEPLFVAYGWGDSEFKWINQTSVAGGSAVASLSTAALSFWSLLPVTEDGGRKSRPLPQHDRGVQLNASKYCASVPSRHRSVSALTRCCVAQT